MVKFIDNRNIWLAKISATQYLLFFKAVHITEEQEVDQAVSPKKNSSEVALYDEISYNETSDEDLKILKIQRAKRVKKKTATKVSISTASHSVEGD